MLQPLDKMLIVILFMSHINHVDPRQPTGLTL
jgi:hypothetical protein